jgi:hypothetical protein
MGDQALPLPGPGKGFHQGFATHCNVPTAAEGVSFANNDAKTVAQPKRNSSSSNNNNDNNDNNDNDDNVLSLLFGKSLSPSNFANALLTPSRHHHYDGPFECHSGMMPLISTRDNPYYRPRMLLVQAPWTVSSPKY